MSATPRYYYVDAQNQAAGPIPMAELQTLHSTGTITDTTLVVVEGGQDWVAFSTLKPAPQPTPQPAAAATATPAAVLPQPAFAASPTPSTSSANQAEPAWATQLLQKIDQLTLTAEKIVAAIEKNSTPRAIPAPAPATAALHAEKINLNPIPKTGLAQLAANNPQAVPTPAAPLPRPGISAPLAPLAVPANAVKPSLPVPALGKPGTTAPAAAPTQAPAKSGNLFSKFLKK